MPCSPDKLTAIELKKDFWQADKLIHVLRTISIEFEQGKSYAITGVSGSGKSTFLHLLGGLDHPTSGTIFFNDQNIATLKKKNTFLNRSIGFVFQFHYLIKELTVLDNVELMGLIKGGDQNQARKHALNLLGITGLSNKITSYPGQLSGGEQQRVSIARALFNKPSFLLADEPTGNLDADNAQNIINLLLKAQQEWGMGIIICTHDQSVYNRMETTLTLHEGILK